MLREGPGSQTASQERLSVRGEGGPVSFHLSFTSMWDLECGLRTGSSICPLSRLGLGHSVAVPTHTFLV